MTGKVSASSRGRRTPRARPESVVIVGGGAAGDSAAATLRGEGYEGSITIVDPDESAPYDRPNCSKDYLAGNAPEEWLLYELRSTIATQASRDCAGRRAMELRLRAARFCSTTAGRLSYGALLLATGA